METLLHEPATEVAAVLRRREISSRELTEALLARIAEVDPLVNAVSAAHPDLALRAADDADRALARGGPLGPLHGVPMTVKDSFHAAGLPTTWGAPWWKDHVADRDATVVRRLRRAGAVIVGKTNVAFLLADYGQTSNEVYGRTSNPWDLARSPGGSSGGAAAAVAAGLSFLEYGSDLVGSLRVPAAFCGVYCLRPTAGTVPTTGHQPPGPPAPELGTAPVAAVGPLGRSPADLRAALLATAGPEDPAARAYAWRLAPPRHTRLPDFRVGVVLDHERAPVSGEVGAVLAEVVERLGRAGVTVVAGWPEGVDPVAQAETFGYQVGVHLAHVDPDAELPDPAQLVARERARAAASAAWSRYFAGVDVFLAPATVTAAIPHDSRPFAERTIATAEGERPYDDLTFWIAHAALCGLPAVVAPVGVTPDRLPVGVQLVGPPHEDDTVLTLAALLADLAPGQPPEVAAEPGR
jgi:amidase